MTFTHNAVSTDIIEFELLSGSDIGRWKQLTIHDGGGAWWNLWTEGSRRNGGRESLWAGQAYTGHLTFWKSKYIWKQKVEMYKLGNLAAYMRPGTRVTFRWVKD